MEDERILEYLAELEKVSKHFRLALAGSGLEIRKLGKQGAVNYQYVVPKTACDPPPYVRALTVTIQSE